MAPNRSNSHSQGEGRLIELPPSPSTQQPHGLPYQQPRTQQPATNGTHPMILVTTQPPHDLQLANITFGNMIRQTQDWFGFELSKKNDTIVSQASEIFELKEQLRTSLQSLHSEIEKNEAGRLEADEAANALANLQTSLEQVNTEKYHLIQVKDDVEAELNESKSKVEALNDKIEAAEAAEEAAVAANERLQVEMDAATEAKSLMEKQLKAETNAVVVAKRKVEELEAKVSALEDEEEQWENHRCSLQEQVKTSQQNLTLAKADSKTCKTELDGANEKVDSLQRDLDTSKADSNKLKTELDESKNHNHELSEALDTARTELKTYKTELDKVKATNIRLQSEKKSQKSAINKLHEELRTANNQKTALDSQRTTAQSRLEEEKQLTVDLQNALKKVKAEKSSKEQELEAAHQRDEKLFKKTFDLLRVSLAANASLKVENRKLRLVTLIYDFRVTNAQAALDLLPKSRGGSRPPQTSKTLVKPAPATQLLSPQSDVVTDFNEDEPETSSVSSFKDPMQATTKDIETKNANEDVKLSGTLANDGSSCFRTTSKSEFKNLGSERANANQEQPQNATLSAVLASKAAESDNIKGPTRTSHPLPSPPHLQTAGTQSSPRGSTSCPKTPASTGAKRTAFVNIAKVSNHKLSKGSRSSSNEPVPGGQKRKGPTLEKPAPKGPRRQGDSDGPQPKSQSQLPKEYHRRDYN